MGPDFINHRRSSSNSISTSEQLRYTPQNFAVLFLLLSGVVRMNEVARIMGVMRMLVVVRRKGVVRILVVGGVNYGGGENP